MKIFNREKRSQDDSMISYLRGFRVELKSGDRKPSTSRLFLSV